MGQPEVFIGTDYRIRLYIRIKIKKARIGKMVWRNTEKYTD